MGRPINNRFINTPSTGIGGEGVDTTSAKVHGGNSYSSGTTVTFANPLAGGTTAIATVSLVAAADSAPGNGNVSGVTVTTAGGGYIAAPVVTFVAPANVVVDGFTQIALDGNISPDIQVSHSFTSIQLRKPLSSPI